MEPVEKQKKPGKYLEDRLQVKFDDLQISREDRQAELFDEVAKSIEVLFRGVPKAHEDLIAEKQSLDEDFENELRDIELEASRARDDIHRNAILQSRGYSAQWEYREVYEEIIMDVMQKHGLIPMLRAHRHQLSTSQETINEMETMAVPDNIPISVRQNPPQQTQPPTQPPSPPQYQQQPPQMQSPPQQGVSQFPPQPQPQQEKKKKKPHLASAFKKKRSGNVEE